MENKRFYKIPDNLYKGKRQKILLILIEELSKWKSSEKVETEEFCELVEKLYKIIK